MSKDRKTGEAITRRAAIGTLAGGVVLAARPGQAAIASGAPVRKESVRLNYLPLTAPAVKVTAYAGLNAQRSLTRSGTEWSSGDVVVRLRSATAGQRIELASPSLSLTHVHLRWAGSFTGDPIILGDHWERSYGDLEWRSLVPERVLPWYCAVSDRTVTHCYGVRTGSAALAFWQVDERGISLWLDVRNGGDGVVLGSRVLDAATIVSREGQPDEPALQAIASFCSQLCPSPRLSAQAVYGSNDWYYAYGHNSAEGTERDADLLLSLAPAGGPKPFTIVDDGWRGSAKFPDMRALAETLKRKGSRPGIWIRPLQAPKTANEALLLPVERYGRHRERASELAYDPTIPEARAMVLDKMKEVVGWGYELVKHDFSTYELLGQWGNEMGASPTVPGWRLHDRSRTNAEVILDLYRDLRTMAGEPTCIIGCNTVGHLAAGLFEVSRTGDDVSGRSWERTRRMGVNTLAFRLPQNRRFFVVDADCVPITKAIDWRSTAMWLDVVARSGTALIVSPEPGAVGPEQREALKDAFAAAAAAKDSAALDWMNSTTPMSWSFQSKAKTQQTYDWLQGDGAWPFSM